MKPRAKPSRYPPIPFHAIRIISFISTLIVTSILGFFCKQLWTDGYKIPWTFIVVFLAALINLLALIITSIISCCATLSPLINLLLNIPILILWIVGISILTWNMYGTLGHSCSMTNWGNDRGVMVCQVYKTLYAFVIFASLAHIAQIVLDIRARREQVRRGKYDKMRDSRDIKIDDLKPLAPSTIHDTPLASETSLPQQLRDSQQHPQDPQHPQGFRDDMPGWRPGQKPTINHSQSYTSSNTGYSNSRSPDRYNNRSTDHYHGYDSSTSVHMQDFTGYQRPQPATHYESSPYHSSYEQRQDDYYQRRY